MPISVEMGKYDGAFKSAVKEHEAGLDRESEDL